MRADHAALLVSVLLLAGCETTIDRVPLPRVAEGGAWGRLAGSGPDDVWVMQLDGARELVFFHSTGGGFAQVPTPEELAGPVDVTTLTSAGSGAVLVTMVRETETVLVRLEADGSAEALDTSGLVPEAPTRRIGIKPASDGHTLYVLADVGVSPSRVYRRDGASWTELVTLPGIGPNPLGVVNGDLWVLSGDGVGWNVLQLTSEGELIDHGTNGTPSFGFHGENLAATAPNDVWLNGQHWDGSSWSPRIADELRVPREERDESVRQFAPIAVAVGPGAIELVSVVVYTRYGMDRNSTELWATRVTREGPSSPRKIGTLESGCRDCPGATPAVLADGTAAFQVETTDVLERTLLLVGPGDL